MKIIKDFAKSNLKSFIRFCLVGGITTIFNYALFAGLIFLSVNYLIASASGYIFGVIIGFALNKVFTFKSKSKRYNMEFVKYLIVYTISLFLGLAFLNTQVNLGINVFIANFLTIGLTTMTNYIGSKYIVFEPLKLIKKFDFLVYRYRYITTYIVIGLGSIFIELLIIALANNLSNELTLVTGFATGMIFSYTLNSKLNFKVPKEKNLQTFKMFALISTFAFLLNLFLIHVIFAQIVIVSYSIVRFVSAGLIFMISYSLHRRYTFTDVKEIGIAVYLSKSENIKRIHNKVSKYIDWIHIDLVDKTFNPNAKPVKISKGFELEHYWPEKKKMTHIMSKKPSLWIDKVAPFSNTIIIHTEIDENVTKTLKHIKSLGKKAGICFLPQTSVSEIEQYLDKVDIVQVLGISKPGESGQHMDGEAIFNLDILNKLKKDYKFDLAFDGGVKLSNVNNIAAKYVVSGSTVLNSLNPTKSIYALKTSSKYYYEHGKDLKKFLRKKIHGILDKLDFVISGTLVGTFSEKPGLEGISDIDTIVIVDKLTKTKFDKIINEFQQLSNILRVDYGHKLKLNTTFGPLKFNEPKTVVIHLMIYDKQGHILHCEKSPFTCLDWQRSQDNIKKSMSEVYEIKKLQPNYFFNARRSVKDYLRDLKSGTISYREYKFTKNKVTEVKKAQKMSNSGKFEFTYHIMKFVMTNFLKLYHDRNINLSNAELVEDYFRVFSNNQQTYTKYFTKLEHMKASMNFKTWNKSDDTMIENFLEDFHKQFEEHFNQKATKLYFMRHNKTKLNKPNYFLGRRVNPSILPLKPAHKKYLNNFFKSKGISEVFASPLMRTIETVNQVKNSLNSSRMILDDDLIEIDYGDMDGKDFKYLSKHYPKLIAGWSKGKDPRFPKGENTKDVLNRLDNFIEKLNPSGDKLICSHNVVLRTLIGKLSNIPKEDWFKIIIPYAEPIEIILTQDRKLFINLTDKQREEMFKNIDFGK